VISASPDQQALKVISASPDQQALKVISASPDQQALKVTMAPPLSSSSPPPTYSGVRSVLPSWADLVALSALTGAAGVDGTDGADGPSIELQSGATHLQWRVVGAATWTDLIALSTITGPAGADGADGADATLPAQVSSSEITTGTETGLRSFSPADVVAIVEAHAPTGGASSVSALTDVDLTGLADNDVLIWDESASEWAPGPMAGGSGDVTVAMLHAAAFYY
jgi:hypothetical protein